MEYITVAKRGGQKAVVTPWGKRWRVLSTGETYATFGGAKNAAIRELRSRGR